MSTTIDVRGLSCPLPIIATKKAIDKNESPVIILSDSKTACENIERYTAAFGWKLVTEMDGTDFKLTLSK